MGPHCSGGDKLRTPSWVPTVQLRRPQTINLLETHLAHHHAASFSPPLLLQSIHKAQLFTKKKKSQVKNHLTSGSYRPQARTSSKEPKFCLGCRSGGGRQPPPAKPPFPHVTCHRQTRAPLLLYAQRLEKGVKEGILPPYMRLPTRCPHLSQALHARQRTQVHTEVQPQLTVTFPRRERDGADAERVTALRGAAAAPPAPTAPPNLHRGLACLCNRPPHRRDPKPLLRRNRVTAF